MLSGILCTSHTFRRFSDNSSLMQVFLPGCQSAPNVPFRFIHIQNFPGLGCQGRIDLRKTFCYIFMYGCR